MEAAEKRYSDALDQLKALEIAHTKMLKAVKPPKSSAPEDPGEIVKNAVSASANTVSEGGALKKRKTRKTRQEEKTPASSHSKDAESANQASEGGAPALKKRKKTGQKEKTPAPSQSEEASGDDDADNDSSEDDKEPIDFERLTRKFLLMDMLHGNPLTWRWANGKGLETNRLTTSWQIATEQSVTRLQRRFETIRTSCRELQPRPVNSHCIAWEQTGGIVGVSITMSRNQGKSSTVQRMPSSRSQECR